MKNKFMKSAALFLTAVLIAVSLLGCSGGADSASSASSSAGTSSEASVELSVFAAASLTESLKQIAEVYQSEHPNVTLTFNFDSSGTLQTQIESGALTDVFISAAQKQMTALSDEGYITQDTKENLLVNKVVLIVPEDSTATLTSFEDCATDAVSLIALGNSDVPVGQYSEEIFTYLGLWDTIQAKASFGTNVKEVLSQVSQGTVDCGVVYATDAATATGVKVVCEAPEDSHSPVVYPAAVLNTSTSSTAAKEFLDFLSSSEAAAIFESVGFTMADQ